MVQLQSDLEQLKAKSVRVVGISYDSVEILKEFSGKQKISYSLLSDPDSKAIDAFKIRNTKTRAGARDDGVPHPATFVIGRDGRITARLDGTITTRHTTKALLDAIK